MPTLRPASLQTVVNETDSRLWKKYIAAVTGDFNIPDASGLVFPTYSDGVVRVSEQEAKHEMVGRLADTRYLYSIETPTLKHYSFTGIGKRSAATDLTIYDPSGKRILNVEFKAHGFSIGRKNLNSVTKDIEKLVREEVSGLWFHTLARVNSGTIMSLWSVLRQEIKQVAGRVGVDCPEKSVFLHICSLKQQVSIQAEIRLPFEVGAPSWLDDVNPPLPLINDGDFSGRSDDGIWLVHRTATTKIMTTIEVNTDLMGA